MSFTAADQNDDALSGRIELCRQWIEEAPPRGIAFFGGAGVSTESGIPDFRSEDGLYAQKYDFPPEVMVGRSFFDSHPKEFFEFYCEKMLFLEAKPNQAHKKLAELEQHGKLNAIITQNVDGLHQDAGSKHVIELHGGVHRNFCMKCGAFYSLDDFIQRHNAAEDGVPRCTRCSGIIKPDVVLYEEPLRNTDMHEAVQCIAEAEMLIIAGTSLVVYPAAGFIDYFRGKHLVIINRSNTPKDEAADLCITTDIGKVFDF